MVIKTVLLEVFQWKEGNYRFEDWDLDTENVLSCNIPSEGVILDTLRIIDEWPMIKQKIPPVDYCPVTILPLTEEIVREHRLTAVDMHVYDLIDEQKNVECIVRQSLEPPFEALSSLVKLIESGLIEALPQGTKEPQDSCQLPAGSLPDEGQADLGFRPAGCSRGAPPASWGNRGSLRARASPGRSPGASTTRRNCRGTMNSGGYGFQR